MARVLHLSVGGRVVVPRRPVFTAIICAPPARPLNCLPALARHVNYQSAAPSEAAAHQQRHGKTAHTVPVLMMSTSLTELTVRLRLLKSPPPRPVGCGIRCTHPFILTRTVGANLSCLCAARPTDRSVSTESPYLNPTRNVLLLSVPGEGAVGKTRLSKGSSLAGVLLGLRFGGWLDRTVKVQLDPRPTSYSSGSYPSWVCLPLHSPGSTPGSFDQPKWPRSGLVRTLPSPGTSGSSCQLYSGAHVRVFAVNPNLYSCRYCYWSTGGRVHQWLALNQTGPVQRLGRLAESSRPMLPHVSCLASET